MAKHSAKISRTQIDPKAGPQEDGFFVSNKVGANADGYFGVVKRTIAGDSTVYTVPCASVQEVTSGNVTLTAEQNGQTVVLNNTSGSIVTLPTAKKGLEFTVVIQQAANTHAVSPEAADGIAAKGLTAVVDKDLVNSTSAAYDAVVIRGVAANLWHAVLTGTWTKQA
jgi:hypothetical protein